MTTNGGEMKQFKLAARLAMTLGVALIATVAIMATAWASNPVPKLNAHRATFTAPATAQVSTWKLALWNCPPKTRNCGHQLFGQATITGTEGGTLEVGVPKTYWCRFQVDVSLNGKYYSGIIAAVPGCGPKPPPTTTTTEAPTTTTTEAPTTTTTLHVVTTSTTRPPTVTTVGHVPPNQPPPNGPAAPAAAPLAMTGAGTGLYVIGGLGMVLMVAGGSILGYIRRYA